MEVLGYIKQIYSGKKAIQRHLVLFSITGLVALMFNNVLSGWGNNILFTLITNAPLSNIEIFLELFFGCCLLLLIFGYEYLYIHNVISNGELTLPELNSDSYSVFFKMLPVYILWQLYYTIISVIGGIILAILKNSAYSYIFSAIMLCLTPFLFMIFIKFAYDFKYTKDIFFPWSILKYLNNSLMDVMKFFLEFCIISALPVFALIGFADWAFSLTAPTEKLIASLSCLCLTSYIFIILKFIFSIGLAKIVKSKFM